MARPVGEVPAPAPVQPDGVTLSEIRPHLVVPALEMVARVFSGDWAEALRRAIHAQVPAERIRVAVRGEVVVGFAMWGAYDGSPDRFGPFGVDPAERGRRIGAALLADALAVMARAGCRRAWFLWTEPDGPAFRLYQRAGFEVTRRFAIMRRML